MSPALSTQKRPGPHRRLCTEALLSRAWLSACPGELCPQQLYDFQGGAVSAPLGRDVISTTQSHPSAPRGLIWPLSPPRSPPGGCTVLWRAGHLSPSISFRLNHLHVQGLIHGSCFTRLVISGHRQASEIALNSTTGGAVGIGAGTLTNTPTSPTHTRAQAGQGICDMARLSSGLACETGQESEV